MPKTIKNLRLHSDKHKPKIKQELNFTRSKLAPNLQLYEQKHIEGSGFLV